MRPPVHVRLAEDTDAEAVQDLAERESGFYFEGWDIDWSKIHPYWVVAEVDGVIVGAIQALPGFPVGRIELLSVDSRLGQIQRGAVVKKITDFAQAVIYSQGSQGVMSMIPFELKSYKKVTENRRWVSIAQGDMILRRIMA